MRHLTRTRLGLAITLIAALAGCSGPCDKLDSITGPALHANGVDLSTYVAVGTSLSSGYESGGVVDRHQIHSYSPLVISNAGRTTGAPVNLSQPFAYHNMGIPGAILLDLVDTTHYHNTVPPVNRQNFTYFNIIQRTRGTVLAQALSLQPTIMSL